jgi:cytoskeleton protein RodZ
LPSQCASAKYRTEGRQGGLLMPNQADWRAMDGEKTPARAVGRLLRDQREELGLTVSDVGQRLRIRRPYIEAIEEGRFDQLPGAAYIPAFLRAYSVHLGLDPVKVLSAYHSSGAVPIERPTGLPVDFPLAERRAPIGLAVLTVLLVIAAGYGVWHFMPRETAVVAQKVPPVPDRLLAERAPVQPEAAPPANGARPATTPQADTWPLPKSETVAPPQTVVAPIAAPPAPASTVGQAQAAQPPAAPESRMEAAPSVEAPPRAEPLRAEPLRAEPVRIDPPRAEPPRVEPPRAEAPIPARTEMPRGPLPAPSEPQEARTAQPREEVSRPVTRDTQIGVRVDSWVELRSANGDILAQTYVRAGETYTIPAGIAFRIITAR